jgi:hypothetical protein
MEIGGHFLWGLILSLEGLFQRSPPVKYGSWLCTINTTEIVPWSMTLFFDEIFIRARFRVQFSAVFLRYSVYSITFLLSHTWQLATTYDVSSTGAGRITTTQQQQHRE